MSQTQHIIGYSYFSDVHTLLKINDEYNAKGTSIWSKVPQWEIYPTQWDIDHFNYRRPIYAPYTITIIDDPYPEFPFKMYSINECNGKFYECLTVTDNTLVGTSWKYDRTQTNKNTGALETVYSREVPPKNYASIQETIITLATDKKYESKSISLNDRIKEGIPPIQKFIEQYATTDHILNKQQAQIIELESQLAEANQRYRSVCDKFQAHSDTITSALSFAQDNLADYKQQITSLNNEVKSHRKTINYLRHARTLLIEERDELKKERDEAKQYSKNVERARDQSMLNESALLTRVDVANQKLERMTNERDELKEKLKQTNKFQQGFDLLALGRAYNLPGSYTQQQIIEHLISIAPNPKQRIQLCKSLLWVNTRTLKEIEDKGDLNFHASDVCTDDYPELLEVTCTHIKEN